MEPEFFHDKAHRPDVTAELENWNCNEARLRALLTAAGPLVWMMDSRGAMIERQPSWEQYTGQNWDEYNRFGWTRCIYPADLHLFRRNWREGRAKPKVRHLQGRIWHAESQAFRAVEARLVPVKSPEGKVHEWIVTCKDINERSSTDQALSESEAQFRAFYEQAAVGIEHVGLDGRLLGGNSMLCRVLGYSDEELKQRTFAQITHPDDLARELPLLEQLIAGKINSYTLEKRYLHKHGRSVWVRVTSCLIRTEQCTRLSIIEDITAAHEAAEAWARSQGQFEAIFNSISDPVMLVDPDRRIVLVNPAFTRVFGYSAQEVIGKKTDFIYTSREEYANQGRLRYNRDADPDSKVYEIEYRRKDGSVFWCESFGVPVKNADGTLIGYMGIHRDITHRKAFEQALRDSQTRLRQSEAVARHHLSELQNIYKSAPIGLCVFDVELRFVRINDLMAQMNGIPVQEHIGQPLRKILPDLAATVEPVLRRVIATRMPVLDLEVSGKTPAQPGVVRHWLESYLPIIDEHLDVIGINVTSIEITDRKRAEQERQTLLEAERAARADAERSSRLKDEFLATVSHELRTPLNAIVGWTRLLSQGKVEDPKALDIIDRNATSLTQIVEDLLDMSRIISGKIRLEREIVDLAHLVRLTMQGVQLAAQAKSICLNASFDPDLEPLCCDPGRIQQIVWNLLTNAIKFTPSGGQVSVAVSQNSDGAEITVSDTGQGIDPEFLPQMFTRFRQADASISRKHGGLGLGLAITRHLIELHGGTIHADSKGPGKGAVFRVSLPSGKAGRCSGTSRLARQAPDGQLNADALAGMRIVVVDDDPESCELVSRILGDFGATVHRAGSTEEAFKALQAIKPDLLISDISMPEEDGYSFVRRIRAAGNYCEGLACLAMTALARPEDKLKAIKAGYDEHLPKPFDAADLVLAVTRLVKRSQQTQQSSLDACKSSDPTPLERETRAGVRLLVVEDNESVSEMLTISLENHGYHVRTAGSVAKALEIAQSWPVDLVVSDLQLNDGTGWDLMSKLKEVRSVCGIVLSGYSESTYQQQSKAAGFSEHLVKPVNDDQLIETIERLVAQGGAGSQN